MEYKVRESNAELLRVICIILILMHHFCVHALYPEIFSTDFRTQSWDSNLILFFHAFIYIGVNCFILISGWFGIKPKWRSFFSLYLIYSFYNLLHPIKRIIGAYVRGDGFVLPYSIGDIIERTLFPFSHGGLWFMDCYLALFLMAPLLNVAIEHMDKKKFLYVIGLLTALNVYFDYFWNMHIITKIGYSISQFVYIYLIGAYLHKYVTAATIDENRWKWFGGYVLCGVFWGCFSLWSLSVTPPPINHWEPMAYNNPILILMAVCFFLFMMSWHFKSKFVNWLAASTLAVYMLNEMVIRYSFIKPYAHRYSPIVQLAIWVGVSLGFYVFAIAIDKIRVVVQMPIWRVYNRIMDK